MKKSNIFPPTAHRVSLKTDPLYNAEIRNQTIRNLGVYKNCEEDQITDRIRILNQEWDTERVLEVNASLLILISSYMGIKMSKCWFLLTGTIASFMLWHAFVGWCPLLPIVRKWGIRTADEIGTEKIALKILRGDFKDGYSTVEDALSKAEKQ